MHQPTKLYFVHPVVDFLMIGGLSIFAYCTLILIGYTARTAEIIRVGAILIWVINWPHFSATSYRLYRSKNSMRQFPLTSYFLPFLILGCAFASFQQPAEVAPYFVKLFLIWSPYHFSGQNVGLTLLYARRAGVRVQKYERYALSAFIFGVFLTTSSRFETGRMTADFYGVKYPALGIPHWVPGVFEIVMWMGSAVFLCSFLYRFIKNEQPMPLILLLPGGAHLCWFYFGASVPAFYEFVPLFHSLQYLFVAWAMQLKEKLNETNVEPSRRYVHLETIRWWFINLGGGIILFWMFPRLAEYFGSTRSMAEGVVISGVQIHHFIVDGVIWKLRHENVSSPLMSNISEFVHKPDPKLT